MLCDICIDLYLQVAHKELQFVLVKPTAEPMQGGMLQKIQEKLADRACTTRDLMQQLRDAKARVEKRTAEIQQSK